MSTYGDTGAPSTNTIYYDDLLTTTLAAYRKKVVDNIFKKSAFLAYLRMNGGVDKQDGGHRVVTPLMYAENDTVKTHAGYDLVDTTPQEGLTNAEFDWAEIAGTISISRKEQRQNAGEGRLINLLGTKVKQAEMTMRQKLNTDLLAGTASSNTFIPDQSESGVNGLIPLGAFCRKDNTVDPTSGNIGNIAGATYSWWRHHTAVLDNGTKDTGNSFASSVSTYAGTKAALFRMYNYCSRGTGEFPNLVVSDQITYETYNNALDQSVRYSDTRLATMGFQSLKLQNATMIWDEVVPDVDNGYAAGDDNATDGTAFFLNTDYYKLIIDSETDIVTTPFVTPNNQTASTAKILFMGQATCSNMRTMGVCYAISQSITS